MSKFQLPKSLFRASGDFVPTFDAADNSTSDTFYSGQGSSLDMGLLAAILAGQDPSNYHYTGITTPGGLDIGDPNRSTITTSPEQIIDAKVNQQAIIDYILGLGSVPKTTETEDTLGQSQDIDLLPGLDAAETDASIVEKIQEQVRRIGSAVGEAQDTVFEMIGVRKPDYSVIQPNAPGGTVIWGQPSGGVFGRIGTTPGGTVTGVQTGIPALDILLGKVADIVSGRAAAGDVLNTQTIKDIIIQTAGDELGIPGDPNQVLADMKAIGSQIFYDENTGQLGIDLGGGADAVDLVTGETATLGNDRAATLNGGTATLDTDRAATLNTGRAATLDTDRAATLNTGRAATLDTDRAATLNTGRAATLDTDRAATLDTDRAATLDTDRAATLNTDRAATLDTDRSGYFDPTATERTGTLDTDRATTSDRSTTSDRAPGGGGVGLGETGVTPTGGIRGVATEQAGVADITMLYDPSLSLAENMARILGKKKNEQADAVDSVLMYGGGIVQPTDLNAEIRRIIEGR